MDLLGFDPEKFQNKLDERCRTIIEKAKGSGPVAADNVRTSLDGIFDGIFILLSSAPTPAWKNELMNITREVIENWQGIVAKELLQLKDN